MDKKYYLAEGYRQLNNTHHYKQIKTPLFPQTSVKVAEILNRLKMLQVSSTVFLNHL